MPVKYAQVRGVRLTRSATSPAAPDSPRGISVIGTPSGGVSVNSRGGGDATTPGPVPGQVGLGFTFTRDPAADVWVVRRLKEVGP